MAKKDIDLKPTKSMIQAAQRGLDLRKEYGRGGTEVGVARARDIVNNKNLSPSTVKRMYSFFSRHGAQKTKGWKPGEEGYPSAQFIAWLLWGGDPGFSWSKRKRDELERAEKNESVTEVTKPSSTDTKVLFSNDLDEVLSEKEVTTLVTEKMNKMPKAFVDALKNLDEEEFQKQIEFIKKEIAQEVMSEVAKKEIEKIKQFEKENNIRYYKVKSFDENNGIKETRFGVLYSKLEVLRKENLSGDSYTYDDFAVYMLNGKILFVENDKLYEATAFNALSKPVKIVL